MTLSSFDPIAGLDTFWRCLDCGEARNTGNACDTCHSSRPVLVRGCDSCERATPRTCLKTYSYINAWGGEADTPTLCCRCRDSAEDCEFCDPALEA